MNTTLLATIGGIALLDSLNPSLFVAQLFLLTTPRPGRRTAAYIAGVIATNFAGGALLLAGFGRLLSDWIGGLSAGVLYGAGWLAGLALILFGVCLKITRGASAEVRQPRSPRLWHAFVFGALVMVNELTTALPYFVALERIAAEQLSLAGNGAALLLYNLIFALPLFAFLGAYLLLEQRFVASVERLGAAVQLWSMRLFKYGSIGLGILLVLNATWFFTSGQ